MLVQVRALEPARALELARVSELARVLVQEAAAQALEPASARVAAHRPRRHRHRHRRRARRWWLRWRTGESGGEESRSWQGFRQM